MCVGERASGDIVTMFYVFCVGKPLRIKRQEGMQAIILSLKDAKEVFQDFRERSKREHVSFKALFGN